jgi:hypothetical protein
MWAEPFDKLRKALLKATCAPFDKLRVQSFMRLRVIDVAGAAWPVGVGLAAVGSGHSVAVAVAGRPI